MFTVMNMKFRNRIASQGYFIVEYRIGWQDKKDIEYDYGYDDKNKGETYFGIELAIQIIWITLG